MSKNRDAMTLAKAYRDTSIELRKDGQFPYLTQLDRQAKPQPFSHILGPNESITGRDGYLVNQALLYAIAQIQQLPLPRQEFANMCDMCEIALAMPLSAEIIDGIEQHVGRKINLSPRGADELTELQLRAREDFTARRAAFKAMLVDELATASANGLFR